MFVASSLVREMEFRANFFAKVMQNLVWMGFFVLVLAVIYSHTDQIAGWTLNDSIILFATCFLMTSVFAAFFTSLSEIPEHVRRGTLDFIITKPIDTQYWVSMRRFHMEQVGPLLAGLVFVGYGMTRIEGGVGLLDFAGYLTLFACALVLFYSFNLVLMTLGIWLVRVDNLWVLGETMMQVARYPVDIFGPRLQRAMTYFLPLAFLATVPARQLVRGFDLRMVVIGLVWAVAAFLFARVFWRFALRYYTSASS